MSGFGALDPSIELGTVPWQCWDIPGFKSCATEAGNATYRFMKENAPSLVEGSPDWNSLYAQSNRKFVYDCQIKFGCTPDILSKMRGGEATSPLSTIAGKNWTMVLLAGVGVAALGWLAYRRMKK